MITITSPHVPPSVNSMFRNVAGKGRVRTQRYRDWAAAAGWDCNGKGKIEGEFDFRLIVSRAKSRKNSDLDNRIKPVMDLLQTHGIIENDSLCQSIQVAYGDCEGFCVEVSPAKRVD